MFLKLILLDSFCVWNVAAKKLKMEKSTCGSRFISIGQCCSRRCAQTETFFTMVERFFFPPLAVAFKQAIDPVSSRWYNFESASWSESGKYQSGVKKESVNKELL